LALTVRRATLNDLDEVHRIESECFAEDGFTRQQTESFLGAPRFVTLIALLDDEPVGFIVGSMDPSVQERACHIYTLDVTGDHRRMGIGSRLLAELEKIMCGKGAEACYLEVRTDNSAAQNLYSKQGFKPLRTVKDYYGHGVDAIRLRKSLTCTQQ
jgi:ribosomal-protein-alanine N-acetyltransferase